MLETNGEVLTFSLVVCRISELAPQASIITQCDHCREMPLMLVGFAASNRPLPSIEAKRRTPHCVACHFPDIGRPRVGPPHAANSADNECNQASGKTWNGALGNTAQNQHACFLECPHPSVMVKLSFETTRRCEKTTHSKPPAGSNPRSFLELCVSFQSYLYYRSEIAETTVWQRRPY